jgi:hypothetical protein
MAGRRTISLYTSTYERLSNWKKATEKELGFNLSWDAFFNYILSRHHLAKTKK